MDMNRYHLVKCIRLLTELEANLFKDFSIELDEILDGLEENKFAVWTITSDTPGNLEEIHKYLLDQHWQQAILLCNEQHHDPHHIYLEV